MPMFRGYFHQPMRIPGLDHVGRLVFIPNIDKTKSNYHCENKDEDGGQYEISYQIDVCSGGDSAPGAVW